MMPGEGVESDLAFVRKLLQASFAGYEKYSAMVSESVSGWEKDRLFSTDMVLIVMGLAEAVSFPTIPIKVTINEYVEISKFYGTPKSRSFVNGLLDRLIQKLSEEGQIVKEGKGLM
jgi:N utilization substance protein B